MKENLNNTPGCNYRGELELSPNCVAMFPQQKSAKKDSTGS
ncbi:hypothetical protein PTRG_09888 [Pyrenophora tritici-repentis Pt-1C-BFP]|uniref:Uncharacterized protein n=1 Tax=Pyrenophora tritici-repentis (strain Pt-1C-BFP) TaxID=426418 RepID=B2WIS9_PYRTR|nr:uncharacterized protein PTRG_09888 [Pyrenophora tritici-repentis Pt-1C-BFP]EDU42939.1 hypothetical protein PTRG_09888 [Pyrenophora tritici-repentis Pt-1C-BFP]KAI1685505.1 hypothetical protein KJE20_05789 [Pyrenophora tritici-repentis]